MIPRTVVLALVILTALSSSTARAVPCGSITAEGTCQGNDVVFCNSSNQLTTIDCENLQISETVNVSGFCDVVAADFGAWCVLPENSSCAVFTEDDFFPWGCAGADVDGLRLTDPRDGVPDLDENFVCDIVSGCARVSTGTFAGLCSDDTALFNCLDDHLALNAPPGVSW